jgi:hypothetical protein
VSCPHAHQQKGVAERKHKHIVETCLAFLATAFMPLKFCDQAFLTATHLINLTPSKHIDYDTPVHRLFGTTPDYSNLRVFDCACWPNLHPNNSHKLQFRSTHCAIIGYNNLHKGYKCLDTPTTRIYISWDVVFDETIFPFATLNPTAGARYTSEVLLIPKSPPMGITDSNVAYDPPVIRLNPLPNSFFAAADTPRRCQSLDVHKYRG